jgi:hypothetical protein
MRISAKGTVNMGNNTGVTPNGVQRGWWDTFALKGYGFSRAVTSCHLWWL